jgi:hypothetical protein
MMRGMDDATGPGGTGPDPEPTDTRSYAERYRGTAWGAPEPTTIPTAAVERRRGGRILIWVGVLLLLGSVAAGIGLGVTGQLDGALGLGPSPSGARPAAPTATTDPVVAARVIDAFAKLATNPRLTYSVRLTSIVTSGKTSVEMAAVGKVAGGDADFRLAITQPAGAVASFGGRVIIKGKAVWVQLDGQTAWLKGSLAPGELPDMNVFTSITGPEDLAYLESIMRRGYRVHHLATTEGWRPGTADRLVAQYPDMRFESATLDLWVRDDGRPIEAQFVAKLSAGGLGTTGIGAQTLVAEATYVLDDVGSKITIKPPK